MKEFFIVANSFAAPFVSDTSTGFVKGETPELALLSFVGGYSHPCGLYSAALYTDANTYHKGEAPLARWLSNHAIFMQDKAGSIMCISPGKVEINGEMYLIENPRGGRIISAPVGWPHPIGVEMNKICPKCGGRVWFKVSG